MKTNQIPILKFHCNFYFKTDRKRLHISDEEHTRYEKKINIKSVMVKIREENKRKREEYFDMKSKKEILENKQTDEPKYLHIRNMTK